MRRGRSRTRPRGARGALSLAAAACVLGLASLVPAQRPAGYAWNDPDWHFSQRNRRVKVVLLAGSIGAFRDQPYGRLLHQWCGNADIQNLSQVGEGAPALLTRFRNDVLDNPNIPVGTRDTEMWLLFGGGLNSVGAPERTNDAIRKLFSLAHRRRFGVVALTLTPWGAGDSDRWRGARGLHVLRSTRSVVDFVLGRIGPRAALGPYLRGRSADADAPWLDDERPDIAVDLYDSRLRDRDAEPWPLDRVRAELEDDPAWRRATAGLSSDDRASKLDADARTLAEAPRWFLAPEYRGFDHVHPNREGHRVIAETVCPLLPESWGCECPENPN